MKTIFYILLPLFIQAKELDNFYTQISDTTINNEHKVFLQDDNIQTEPKWSFGITYIPYYSDITYVFYSDPYYSNNTYVTTNSENITMMEGQFSYLIFSKLRTILNIGYISTYSRDKNETHVRYIDPNNTNYDYGTIETNELKIFSIDIGIKYYFMKLIDQKISPYVFAGVGKKYAFADNKSQVLYQTGIPDATFDDNASEFLEDLNSPFQLNAGFGVEYMLNNYISVFSNIRFYYSKRNAEYDYRKFWNYSQRTETRKTEYNDSDTVTHIGLGINFYF